jgi:titin
MLFFSQRRQEKRRPVSRRPEVEALEERLAPATFSVTNTADSGPGSLRRAISNSNNTPGFDTINFNIPTSDAGYNSTTGTWTIRPASQLLTVTNSVTINGYSQPGASANTRNVGSNAKLKIVLDGSQAGSGAAGLFITGGLSTVQGLVIENFENAGIILENNGLNTIAGNYIGTNYKGTLARGNGGNGGVLVANGSNYNLIGGVTPAARNVISGNEGAGIALFTGVTNNTVQGNYVGTDATGTRALGNGGDGVNLQSFANNNTIGGLAVGAGNLVSGNGNAGIHILDSAGNLVQGNYVGTDISGTHSLANVDSGILLDATSEDNTIGGVAGGSSPIAPGVGSVNPKAAAYPGNLVSGNGGEGVVITESSDVVEGNYIGTDVTGTVAVPNGSDGVRIQLSTENTVGGTAPGAGNLISGNAGNGVFVLGSTGALGNAVQGNYIGTDHSGANPLANGGNGVLLYFQPVGNVIGQAVNGPPNPGGNVIAFNGGAGVSVNGGTNIYPGNGNAVLGNSIFSNVGGGIVVGPGSNNNIAAPTLTSALVSTGDTINILGTLTGTAGATYRVEFFASPSGGQGQFYLGFALVTTNSQTGVGTINVTLPDALPFGYFITATATDSDNDTSPFSAAVQGKGTIPATGGSGSTPAHHQSPGQSLHGAAAGPHSARGSGPRTAGWSPRHSGKPWRGRR